jgi:hypothetical protein
MNTEFVRMLKEAIEAYAALQLAGLWNATKTSVRIASLQARFLTLDLPFTK